MNFSTDRDLLPLEPEAFTDAPLLGQTRVDVHDGQLEGTTLTSAAADFAAAGVEPGHVVLLGRTPFEVIDRPDAGTLTVSLPRTRTDSPPLPAPHLEADAPLRVRMRTFAPQAALVRDALMRMLGLSPDDEDAVLSLGAMARLEALGTLDLIYQLAATLTDDDQHSAILRRKAAHHRAAFLHARRAARIAIDTDADGHPNEHRRPGLLKLQRI